MRVTLLSAAALLLTACGQSQSAMAVTGNDVAMSSTTTAKALASAPVVTATPSPLNSLKSNRNSIDESNAGVVKVLSDVLVPVGRLDGAPISAIRQVSQCVTIFSAKGLDVTIDWAKVSDWLSRNEDGRVLIPIASEGRTYMFTVPQAKQPEPIGDAGATVESAFGSLADSCGST